MWFHCESLGTPYIHPLYGSLTSSSGDWECFGRGSYSFVCVVVKSRCFCGIRRLGIIGDVITDFLHLPLFAGPGLVITSPSGSLVTTAASAQTFPISAPMIVSALPPGSQAALQVVPDLSKKGTTTLAEGAGAGGVAPKPPRGRKKKRLQESGLPEMSDPFVLTNEDDEDQHKDGKTYRWGVGLNLDCNIAWGGGVTLQRVTCRGRDPCLVPRESLSRESLSCRKS